METQIDMQTTHFRDRSLVSGSRQIIKILCSLSLLAVFVGFGIMDGKTARAQGMAEAVPSQLFLPMLSITAFDVLQISQQDGQIGDDNEPVDSGVSEDERLPAAEGQVVDATPIVDPAGRWQADMETANLSQWRSDNNSSKPEMDSGACSRPQAGVTSERAYSGSYSMKMTINSNDASGCRQFRKLEPASGNTYYYSAWYYIPVQTQVSGFWNIMQFKSNLNGLSSLFWKLDVRNAANGQMYVILVWKGPIAGPRANDGIANRLYYQIQVPLPVGQWFQLEVFLKQSAQFDGQIIVWQDGTELFNGQNVRTKYPGGYQNWSVNNYGEGLSPNPATLYIDDAVISNVRSSQ
jgi:hypothetical protein